MGALSRSSTPGSTHTALFCIHLLSSAFRQAAAFPGLLAAQPALLWQGEDGCCGVGGGRGDVPFARQGRGNGCAVAGLERWRCQCIQLERTARDCSGRHPRGSCWKKAGGCRGAVAATAPGMPRLWARSKEQNRNMFCSLLFPPPGCRPQGCTRCHLFAQADWPLEGTRLPMEPPRMAGSTVRLCGARATCPGLLLSTRKRHGRNVSLLATLSLYLCGAVRETACWLWAPCRSSER